MDFIDRVHCVPKIFAPEYTFTNLLTYQKLTIRTFTQNFESYKQINLYWEDREIVAFTFFYTTSRSYKNRKIGPITYFNNLTGRLGI